MATYVIGDIQGCYIPFRSLLDKVEFNPDRDALWIAGDIVNRGPASLSTLRFLKNLGDKCIAVLGNHDFHLIALALGVSKPKKKDTLQAVLEAPDRDELLNWLCSCPLIHYSAEFNALMSHAGIPPHWSLKNALEYASQVEAILQDAQQFDKRFAEFYEPIQREPIPGQPPSLATTLTYLTRMRFCKENGTLDTETKGCVENAPDGYAPWFSHPHQLPENLNIFFGH